MPNTPKRFRVGDHVSWNSEAGRVRATPEEPQYRIKSDTTDHISMHKGAALRRL